MKKRMDLVKASYDNVCPVTGFLFMNPQIDGRLVKFGQEESIIIVDQQQEQLEAK